jgi:hypothetical protein
MWISRQLAKARPELWTRARDAFGLAVVFGFIPELARARAGVALEPHPAWIAVLLLSARDGRGGFFAGLIVTAAVLAAGSAIAGAGLAASWSSLDSGPDLVTFGACLVVSWIASWHLRRHTDLHERLRVRSERVTEAEASIDALRDVVAMLRARVDRTSNSLSFIRDVAARLEGKDPVAVAEGAADLALVRTGATAVQVIVGRGGFERLLAVRDAREPGVLTPLAQRDADVKVPIRNGNHRVGVIALWGIPRPGLDEATAHDLEVIASWCVPALAVAAWRPEQPADSVRRVS